MILNRDAVMSYASYFPENDIDTIGRKFITQFVEKDYSIPEIKALRDLKFLEASV